MNIQNVEVQLDFLYSISGKAFELFFFQNGMQIQLMTEIGKFSTASAILFYFIVLERK